MQGKIQMENQRVHLLDCTLRDGGYINGWHWGEGVSKAIVWQLSNAGIDAIEVGFLRDVDFYNPDVTVCNHIEELNRLLPDKANSALFSAMAMRSNYSLEKLSDYSGSGIELIRVTAHEYDIWDGIDFAEKIQQKGYKVSINPINIMGYSDAQILEILKKINIVHPYQFSIVDTFGSMKRRDMDRIVSLVDHNIDSDIRVGLHLHENMSISCSLAQAFVDKHLERPITIDGSLAGMGRTPGNLPIELIADYLNDFSGKKYDMDYLLDAIYDYIAPMKGKSEWGYDPEYFLSARFNLHRNYAEFYQGKGDLTTRDINNILSRFEASHAAVFDEGYAESKYWEYKDNRIDDRKDRLKLAKKLKGKKILILAPGASLKTYKGKINDFISTQKPEVIFLNFFCSFFRADYVFFGNNKRFCQSRDTSCEIISTSNVIGESTYKIDYNSVTGAFERGNNTLVMVLKFLKDLEITDIYVAGADGFAETDNYYTDSIRNEVGKGNKYNMAVAEAIKRLNLEVVFITPTKYQVIEEN